MIYMDALSLVFVAIENLILTSFDDFLIKHQVLVDVLVLLRARAHR